MKIEQLKKLAGREEIDYQFLVSALSGYSRPREKISSWLKSGDLIRVKKGLYLFGKHLKEAPYSKEVLANLIYGPSAISLTYAMAFYGLIPERVETVTSITPKRNKSFTTPVGEFTYQYINPKKYAVGITLNQSSKTQSFLIASPEKALCDHIHLTDKPITLPNIDAVETYLFHDLRVDESVLHSFRITKLTEIVKAYNDTRLSVLTNYIKKWKKS